MGKKLLQKSILLALAYAGLFFKMPEAKAQALDVLYSDSLSATSPTLNYHAFSMYLYQNCNPAPMNFSNIPVIYKFNNSTPVNEVIAVMPNLGMGNPFCSSQSPVCSATGPLNFQKSGGRYTFSTRQWGPSTGFGEFRTMTNFAGGLGNFTAANITGNFGYDPEVWNVVSSGMLNSPPAFINPPVIFTNVNQPVSYSCGAIDADDDSLVYRLRPVNNNATYAPGFTYLNPITANPAFALNSLTGVITFTPTAYDQTAGPGATANKYVVGMDVDEYRKLNGVVTKIGTIQRNVLINVISTGNNSPVLTASLNNVPHASNTILDVYAGTPVIVNFAATDPDVSNTVSLSANVLNYLPGSTFAPVPGQGTVLTWTPTAAYVRNEPYLFNVTATDNACPYPASVTQTYSIRVRQALGLKPESASPEYFLAFPNPSTNEINFKLTSAPEAQYIIICNAQGQEVDHILLPAGTKNNQPIRWEHSGKFAAGLYVAKLISKDKTIQTLKFTKLQ